VKCRVSRKIKVLRDTVLKLYLLIFSDRIFDSRVEGGIPNCAAAAAGKRTVWARALGLHRRYHSEDRPTRVAWWPKRGPQEIAIELGGHHTDKEWTDREVEVLQKVVSGNTNKIIADGLDASEETVKAHMRKILSKLHANDRTHAVAIAVKRGMIEI